MKYSVYQHWDPLKVCIVGRSYSPEFYHFIKNDRVRIVMERIARETEEDYQKLVDLLESFGVKVLRPNVRDNYKDSLGLDGKIKPPPMTPRDYTATLGDRFFIDLDVFKSKYDIIKGADWPVNCPVTKEELPDSILKELTTSFNSVHLLTAREFEYKDIVSYLSNHMTIDKNKMVDTAGVTRIGKDVYVGNDHDTFVKLTSIYPEYRCHMVEMDGHSDANFCPVVPGLIVSLCEVQNYAETFPDWEVVYLPDQSWAKVYPFLKLKEKNKGKWWVPGEELNDEFTDFVEQWLGHWVGYVEETVFDVNMLVIDKHNVVCNNYNKEVFDAFKRHGVTPHVINFRHRYFWDGGLHCITSDVHREGTMEDYFPERN